MTTFCPLRERRMDGRSRLSCESAELQTRHGQASVGTPIEVPEPKTVIFSGVRGMVNEMKKALRVAEPGRVKRACSARLGFGLCRGLRCHRLADLDVGQFELAEQVQKQIVFFWRQMAFGLFV